MDETLLEGVDRDTSGDMDIDRDISKETTKILKIIKKGHKAHKSYECQY